MSTKYCQQCGEPHSIGANFCGSCRNAFPGAKLPTKVIQAEATPRRVVETVNSEDDDYEGAEVTSVPKIEHPQIIITPPRNRKTPLGSLLNTQEEGSKFSRDAEKPLSRKKLLEEFRKEAGAIKPK